MNRARTMLRLALAAAAAALLVGCTLPAPGGGTSSWIDAPLHESTHPVAPMEIVLHAADPGGIVMIELSVNGEVLARRPPEDTSAPLVTFHAMWDPSFAGDYVLTARAQNHAGAWSMEATTNVSLIGPGVLAEVEQPLVSTATPTPAGRVVLTPTWTPTVACIDRAAFVADVTIPDNTVLAPGAGFTKIWRLRNDGDCQWTEKYTVVFTDGAAMSNNTPLALPGIVPPGSTVDIAVDLVAPTMSDSYRSYYLLQNPNGALFGLGAAGETPFYVQIVVAGTPTPKPPQPDTQPPSVSVSHSPSGSSLPTGSIITFTANASDNVGVTRIDVWVTAPGGWPTLVKTCHTTTTCSHTGGPYNSAGQLSYFAIAGDAAGHETNSGGHTITIYVVISGRPGNDGI